MDLARGWRQWIALVATWLVFGSGAACGTTPTIDFEAEMAIDGPHAIGGTELPGASAGAVNNGLLTTAQNETGRAVERPPGAAGDQLEASYQLDPRGYPATADETPTWCATESDARDERCASGVDEDCDGIVDEYTGLGEPCITACSSPGLWACSPQSHALSCLTKDGYPPCNVPKTCGNGRLDPGEPCDHSAGTHPDWSDVQPLEPYCTGDCRIDTYFPPPCLTVREDGPDDVYVETNACAGTGLVCSKHVRTCVPTTGPAGLDRCPRLRIPESDQQALERRDAGIGEAPVYPMVETDDGECWITCRADADCPVFVNLCYMGTCVVP